MNYRNKAFAHHPHLSADPLMADPEPMGKVVQSTSWTSTSGGNFNAGGNWSNGVPTSGVQASIIENSNDSITVTISSASDIADSLQTQYAGLLLSNGTLTLQGVTGASSISTGTGTALTENGGLLDFQNGPSEAQDSSISAGGVAVNQTAGTIEVDAGLLTITGSSSFAGTLAGAGTIALSGATTYSIAAGAAITVSQLAIRNSATVSLGGNLSYAGGLSESAGTTLALGGKTLTLADTATANSVVDGAVTNGTLVNSDQLVISGATIDSNTTLTNKGLLLLNTGGGTALTMVTDGTTAPLLSNTATGTLEAENGTYVIYGGSITNAGTLLLGTAGNLTESAVLTSTKSIVIGKGDTFSAQNSFSISGVLGGGGAGAGTFAITGGGTDTLSANAKVSVGAFIMNVFADNVTLAIDTTSITSTLLSFEQGGNADFNTSLSYAGTFAASANAATLFLNLGTNTLTLNGPASFAAGNFGNIDLTGTGSLVLNGASSLTLDGLMISDGATIVNNGTMTQDASIQIGDSLGVAAIVNGAPGIWDDLAGTLGSSGSNIGSSFTNAGLFENTGSTSIPIVDAAFTNTGTVSVATGYETDFYGGMVNSGAISGGGTVSLRGAGTYAMNSGTKLSIAQLNLYDSAVFSLGAAVSYGGILNDLGAGTYSTVLELGSFKLTLSGTQFFGSTAVSGSGTLALTGSGTVSAYDSGTGILLGGGATLVNSGSLVQDGNVQIGDASGLSASATNTATGTWTLANGYGLTRGSITGETFLNQGLFQNTDQGGTPTIASNFVNSGTVNVTGGAEIDFYNSFTNTGTASGAGAIGIRGSAIGTIGSAGTLTIGTLSLLDTATLILSGNTAYGGTFVDQGSYGDTLNLGGNTFTLSGTASFGNDYNGILGSVTGGGELYLTGQSTITATGLGIDLGGSTTILNTGTLQQNGVVEIGDSSGQIATVTNTGTWNLDTGNGLYTGSNSASKFINSGLLQNIGAQTTQGISTVFQNTGTLSIGAGNETDFSSTATLGGTLTGPGAIGITGGSATISAGAVVSVGEIDLYDTATLTLNEGLSYSGTFVDQGNYGATLNLNGKTLTLHGSSYFGNDDNGILGTVTGGGKIANLGTMSITDTNFGIALGSTSSLTNSKLLIQNGALQIGDSSGNIATVTNTGTWNNGTGATISTGTNASSSFTNTGSYFLNATDVTQTISATFINSGTINSGTADTIDFANYFTNTGTVAGAGAVGVTSGQTSFAAGTKLTVASLYLYSDATMNFTTSLTYAGNFIDQGTYGNTLSIGGNTLTLTGTDSFGNNYNGILGTITGSGTLALAGTSTITNTGYGVEFGSSLSVVNTGTMTQNGAVQLGDSSGALASITNAVGGVWNFTTNNGVFLGTNASAAFTNAGLVEDTGTGNTLSIGAVFNTTGTVNVVNATSTLALSDGGSLAGTLSGAGALALNGGLFTLATAATLSVGALGIHGGSTTLQLSAADTYSGQFTLDTNATVSLNGTSTVLKLSGPAELASLITGSGTITALAGSSVAADGATIGGSATLLDNSLMALASGLTVGNLSTSSASLQIGKTGTLELTGNATIASNGTGAISNLGTFEMVKGTGSAIINPLVTNTGSGQIFSESGTMVFASAVSNDGSMTSLNGDGMVFQSSLNGIGSAVGVVNLTAGGFATFDGFVGTGETLAFTDTTTAVANLYDASGFNGTFSGFGGHNDIHLFNFANATDSFANNTLSLTGTMSGGGVAMASLHFTSGYALNDFMLTSDGTGGTNITFT